MRHNFGEWISISLCQSYFARIKFLWEIGLTKLLRNKAFMSKMLTLILLRKTTAGFLFTKSDLALTFLRQCIIQFHVEWFLCVTNTQYHEYMCYIHNLDKDYVYLIFSNVLLLSYLICKLLNNTQKCFWHCVINIQSSNVITYLELVC
jgi:hypothetical protein